MKRQRYPKNFKEQLVKEAHEVGNALSVAKRHKVRDRKTGTQGLNTGRCTRGTGFTKCRQQRSGRGRMPCSEEHRKAVCGKTACTV